MYLLITLKIVSLFVLLAITTQDIRERNVYAWLFICLGILMSLFYFFETDTTTFFVNIGVNISLILLISAILYLYSKFKLKQPISKAFGLGDLLFFVIIAISFPITSFIILFSFSLFFSLIVFLALKISFKHKSVPLAGLQALFFMLVFSLNWTFKFVDLYAL